MQSTGSCARCLPSGYCEGSSVVPTSLHTGGQKHQRSWGRSIQRAALLVQTAGREPRRASDLLNPSQGHRAAGWKTACKVSSWESKEISWRVSPWVRCVKQHMDFLSFVSEDMS